MEARLRDEDQQRLTIALGIIATAIGVFALPNESKLIHDIIAGLMLIPALSSFLFIISTAAHLKYKRKGELGELAVSNKFRQNTYDFAIDMFSWVFSLAILYMAGLFFGWDGKNTITLLTNWRAVIVGLIIFFLLTLAMAIGKERGANNSKRRASSKAK